MRNYLNVPDSEKNKTDKERIHDALVQQQTWFDYYQNNISTAVFMRQFLYADGGQWTADEFLDRKRRGKTMQQNNMLAPIVRTIVGQERAHDPQCIVIPTDAKVPTDILKLKTGLHREIAYQSNTKNVFAKCYADMVEIGWGQFNVVCKPESNLSFKKVLRYESPEDVLYSYWDSSAQHQNKIDGDFAGYYFFSSKEATQRKYGKDDIQSIGFPSYWGDNFSVAKRKDVLVLLCHYKRVYGEITMCKLSDGAEMPYSVYRSVKKELEDNYRREVEDYNKKVDEVIAELKNKGIEESKIDAALSLIPKPEMPNIPRVKKRQRCVDYYIQQEILSGNYVLETAILPLKIIPQFYVGGDNKRLNGAEVPQPYTANAIVPQRLLNYCVSELIDNIGRALGTTVLAHEDAVEDKEEDYARSTISTLKTYKSIDSNPNEPSRPQLTYQSGVDPALMQLYIQCQEDIKATLGRYNENMGDQSNAYGYDAILTRQVSGDMSVAIIPDNLNMAIAEGAKCIFEWMPYVYDTERNIMIRGKDGKSEFTTINRPTGERDSMGNLILENDMRVGKFSVEVYGGLSFAMQRLAGMKFLGEVMANDETLKRDLFDLYLECSPFDFSNEAIRRLKSTGYINPAVVAEEEGKPAPKPKPSPMEELAKLKMISEVKKMHLDEQKGKLDLMNSIMDMKIKVSSAKAQEKQAEQKMQESNNQLLADTIESYARVEEANAEVQNNHVQQAADLLEKMIEKESAEIEKQSSLT